MRWLSLLLAIAWAWLIFVLMSGPARIGARSFGWSLPSNGGHAFVFAILSLLLALGLPRGARPRFWIFLLASAYGVFLEWMQSFEPSRTADFLDWLTDSLGAIFGLNLLGIGLLWTLDRQARRQWIGYFLLLGTLCFLSALAATLF